jgi:HAD superfamily hydrolase (TIGR01549 family)
MPNVFLFDLDMTLVDSSALAQLRRNQLWREVRSNMHLIRSFPALGSLAPHELPARLKQAGHKVGIVTSSPNWYAEAVVAQFRIPHDVLISYGDTENHKPNPDPLLEALKRLGVAPSPAVFYIGDDVGDVEASYHAGITSIGVRWGPTSIFELASAAPDIFIGKPSTLLRTDTLDRRGYAGECMTAGMSFAQHWGSLLTCGGTPTVYALGRYFTASDPRHAASALSAAVLTLKNSDNPASVLGRAVGLAIQGLDWVPEYIVPVPPKPSQERHRFQKMLDAARDHLPDDVEIVLDGLRCIKEVEGYKRMSPLDREDAIRGAFVGKYTWGEAKILVLDDVYTTGGTTNECVRILKTDGAGEIRVLALAKDQRTFVRKTCSACGRSMRIRNNSSGVKFWGCSGYPHSCQNTENL